MGVYSRIAASRVCCVDWGCAGAGAPLAGALDLERLPGEAQPLDEPVAHRGRGRQHAGAWRQLFAVECEAQRALPEHDLRGLVSRIALGCDAAEVARATRRPRMDLDAEEAVLALALAGTLSGRWQHPVEHSAHGPNRQSRCQRADATGDRPGLQRGGRAGPEAHDLPV